MKKSFIVVVSAIVGVLLGTGVMGNFLSKKIDSENKNSNKFKSLFLMMNHWVKIKQDGKSLASYFEKNGYKKIAIYGMGYVGETLLDELRNTDISIAYGIDRRAEFLYMDIDIISIDDPLEEVDAVVVTVIASFDEIEKKISEKMDCAVISLEDVLDEI